MRSTLRGIYSAMTPWFRAKGPHQPPDRPESDRDGGENRDNPARSAATRQTDVLHTDGAAYHALLEEIRRSDDEHQAIERDIWAAQIKAARNLNLITALGAIVSFFGLLAVAGTLLVTKNAADDAHMALVAANRAWIGPVSATLAAIPGAPPSEDMTVLIPFRNTGHEPATDAWIIGNADSITIDAPYDEIHAKEQAFEDYCLPISATKNVSSAVSIVVFPGTSAANDYKAVVTIKSDLIDWDVVYGKKYLFLHACVVYQTFGEVRHTSVCYYAQAGKTVGSLPLCDKGNRAD